MSVVVYAEIQQSSNIVRGIGSAPFLPIFSPSADVIAVDITSVTPQPLCGWTWDGLDFHPPATPTPKPNLVITSLDVMNAPQGKATQIVGVSEATIPRGATISADVEIQANSQLIPVDLPFCRMPIKSTDGRITYAIVEIAGGRGTVVWTPELTGRWQITEILINSELPPEAHMSFDGVDIFVY